MGWVQKLSSNETSNWRSFDILSFILGLCHCNLDSTFYRAYSRGCPTRRGNLPSFIINCQLIQLMKNLSRTEIIDPRWILLCLYRDLRNHKKAAFVCISIGFDLIPLKKERFHSIYMKVGMLRLKKLQSMHQILNKDLTAKLWQHVHIR